MDFNNSKICYTERNKKARLFLESFQMAKTKNNNMQLINNKQNANISIPPIYYSLLHKTSVLKKPNP